MQDILIGIDVGTSACKVAAFHPDGRVVAQETRPYEVSYAPGGVVEQDPNEWWKAIADALKAVVQRSGLDASRVRGIGVDGQSWSAIPVDADGQVLARTPIWMDSRSTVEVEEAKRALGESRLFAPGQNSFEPQYTTPKLLWFRKHQPDLYKRARYFLQSNSFIVHRLTGVFSMDRSQGYGVHYFDTRTGGWDEALCRDLGLRLDHQAPLFDPHDVVGTLTSEVAAQVGLKAGVPVVAGGLDAACGTLGAGVTQPGQVQEQGGQSGGMSICVDRPDGHPKLIFGRHVVPGSWLLQGGTVGGGGSLRWFKKEFCPPETPFETLSQEAGSVPVGSEGLIFLPYLAGERSPLWDREAQGVFFGLSYSKTRAHLARAVMEGCAFALEHNLRTAAEAGAPVGELLAMGGSANSLVWTQIKADVTGKRIRVPASDTASTLGAALLAGVGTGLWPDFTKAAADTISIVRTHEPQAQNHRRYQQLYPIYREIYENLKDTMKKTALWAQEGANS